MVGPGLARRRGRPGGVAWTFAGAVALGQPVPPDWPGYLQETLPVFLAASPLLLLATLGASTRLGPCDPSAVRVGRPFAVVGWLAWILLLAPPSRARAPAPALALAATIAAAGTFLVGIALLASVTGRRGRPARGGARARRPRAVVRGGVRRRVDGRGDRRAP